MKDETKIDLFISILHDILEKKANITNADVKIKLKIRDRLWSVCFLSDFTYVSIGVSKNGVTQIYHEINEEGEENFCTIKEFLTQEIIDGKITILELEMLLFQLA